MTKRERLNKIQIVLEESLGLIWVDRIIYNYNTRCYRTANILDFCPDKSTYTYLRDNKNNTYLAKVVLNDEKFVINVNGMKIDASEHWKELLQQEMVVTTLE